MPPGPYPQPLLFFNPHHNALGRRLFPRAELHYRGIHYYPHFLVDTAHVALFVGQIRNEKPLPDSDRGFAPN
jgi:hypothetical protein